MKFQNWVFAAGLFIVLASVVGVQAQAPVVRPEPLKQLSLVLDTVDDVVDRARGYQCPDLNPDQARRIALVAGELEDLLRHYPGLLKEMRLTARDHHLQKVREVVRSEAEIARLQYLFAWQNYVLSIGKAMLDLADVMSLGKDVLDVLKTNRGGMRGLLDQVGQQRILDWVRRANDTYQAIDGARAMASEAKNSMDALRTRARNGGWPGFEPPKADPDVFLKPASLNLHAAIDSTRKLIDATDKYKAGLLDATKLADYHEALRGDLVQLVGGIFGSAAEQARAEFAGRIGALEGQLDSSQRNLAASFRDWRQYSLAEQQVEGLLARLRSTRKRFDLMVSGYFGPQHYRLYPVPPQYPTAGQRIMHLEKDLPQFVAALSSAVQGFRASRPIEPRLYLEKKSLKPGETMQVRFWAPACLSKIAWVGIVPSDTTHGSEDVNDKAKIGSRRTLGGLKEGTLMFQAPAKPGSYDVRMNDGETTWPHGAGLGKELTSLTFSVINREEIASHPFPANGYSTESTAPLEGNWLVEWHDYPQKGQVTRAMAVLARQWEQACVQADGGCRFENRLNPGNKRWTLRYTTDFQNWGGVYPEIDQGGKIKVQWGYRTLGGWGGRSELTPLGSTERRGRWSYEPEKKGGAEVWRRAVPRITHVVFSGASHFRYDPQFANYDLPSSRSKSEWRPGNASGRVDGTLDRASESMRGNRPVFRIEIYGENLWGFHLIDLHKALDLEPLPQWRTYIMKDGSRHGAPPDPRQVAGIEQTVVIAGKARPGRYTVRVDGVPVPFDFVIPALAAR